MPEPIPDINRDHQCYFYIAPSGQRCGSPALKGEYYCYHHHLKHANRTNRVLIDPEVTRMEIPVIEDRASIFVALAAVLHRLAENTIDTRRAGQMIYGLQVAMRALDPPPIHRSRTNTAAPSASAPQPAEAACRHPQRPRACRGGVHEPRGTEPATTAETTSPQNPPAPKTIPITREALVYFLRSRHCASCNAELFPAEELTERPNPGAPSEIIEEARPALPAPQPAILPGLHAVASDPASNLEPCASNLNSTFISRFALHSPRRSVSLRLVHMAPHISASRSAQPQRILNQKANRRKKWQQ